MYTIALFGTYFTIETYSTKLNNIKRGIINTI